MLRQPLPSSTEQNGKVPVHGVRRDSFKRHRADPGCQGAGQARYLLDDPSEEGSRSRVLPASRR